MNTAKHTNCERCGAGRPHPEPLCAECERAAINRLRRDYCADLTDDEAREIAEEIHKELTGGGQ